MLPYLAPPPRLSHLDVPGLGGMCCPPLPQHRSASLAVQEAKVIAGSTRGPRAVEGLAAKHSWIVWVTLEGYGGDGDSLSFVGTKTGGCAEPHAQAHEITT